MKKIITIACISIPFFISCQPSASSEETSAVDTMATAVSEDTAALPPAEEVVADALDTEENQVVEEGPDYDYTYEGTLNDKIKVKVNIFKYRNEKKARAVYLSTKKIIEMDSEYPQVGNFVLTEKVNGKPTGIWKIEAEEEDNFSGTWSSPDGSKQMPIRLTMSSEDFDNFLPTSEIRTGFYKYREVNEDAETKDEFPTVYLENLFVKNMSDNSIYFDLYIQGPPPGVHMGMVNGIANKSGNNYVYKNDEGCEITMAFSGDKVTLSQKGTDFNCEFGANISAFGVLKKEQK